MSSFNDDSHPDEQRLRRAVDALPRDIQPERDLWTEIAPRLRARSSRRPARAAWGGSSWVWRIAAAIGFMALGAVLGQLVTEAESPRAPGVAVADGPRSQPESSVMPASARSAELRLVEADYLEAKEALWLSVYRNRDRLAPETVALVEENLRVIDRAIRELRVALEQDPGNTRLQDLLLASHDKEIGLLQRLATGARSTA